MERIKKIIINLSILISIPAFSAMDPDVADRINAFEKQLAKQDSMISEAKTNADILKKANSKYQFCVSEIKKEKFSSSLTESQKKWESFQSSENQMILSSSKNKIMGTSFPSEHQLFVADVFCSRFVDLLKLKAMGF